MDGASPPTPAQFPPGYLEEDHSGRVIAAATTILVLATIFFALRLIARNLTAAKRGWDDHLLIPSYLLLVALIATLYVDVTQAGLGRHAAAVVMEDPNKITTFFFLLYLLDWFYVPSNMLSRVSIVILYLRIFTDRWARAACWAVIAFLVANCVATTIAAQLECMPLQYTWDKSILNGKCFNQLLWYKLTNFPNIVGDVLVLLLPIKTVWTIKASTARKAGIAAVCLTGSIGIIASSVRTSVFFINAHEILTDPTFAEGAFTWTAIECGLYFSAACLIGLRPLFTRLPRFIKDRLSHLTNESKSSKSNTRDTDELRLNDYYKNPYDTVPGDEEAGQIPLGSVVSSAQFFKHDNATGGGNGIHVETHTNITRT
ncbi:hypothetical protein F4808DRAFT_443429 [Astrocystis sublimbata]|nr:hypothetical protein F4808DRAFT_443429 [Astrocystis sublimbata]